MSEGSVSSRKQFASPDQELMFYANILDRFTALTPAEDGDLGQPIHAQQFFGDYRRDGSFHRTGALSGNVPIYSQEEPSPPITQMMKRLHTCFRAGTQRLPRLDEQALKPETRKTIAELRQLVREHQEEFQKTGQENNDSITTHATAIVQQLNESELATASHVPILIANTEGVAESHVVENTKQLGLYLLALSFAPQMLQESSRVPKEINYFLSSHTKTAMELVAREVKRLYKDAPTQDVRRVAEANFSATSSAMLDTMKRHEHHLQLEALAAPEEIQKDSIKTLQELGMPLLPTQLDNNLEVAVVLESIAVKDSPLSQKDTLMELASRHASFARINKPSSPELLQETQETLAGLSGDVQVIASTKLTLLRAFIEQEQMQAHTTVVEVTTARDARRARQPKPKF